MKNISIYEYTSGNVGQLILESQQSSDELGFRFVDLTKSPLQPMPECKDPEKMEYAEEDGYRIKPNQHKKSFEYTFTLTFILSGDVTKDASGRQGEINKNILAIQKKMQGKQIIVFNGYRCQTMVGYVIKGFKISDPEKVYERDIVDVEVTLDVNDPSLCDFETIDKLPKDGSTKVSKRSKSADK